MSVPTDLRHEASARPASAAASWRIALDGVSVTYPNGTRALHDVSLQIEPGEMVSIVGLSGSGKSTLIRTINGLVPATTGSVTVGPHRVSELRGRALREARGHIGMIFQAFNLAERANVYRNTLVGRFAHSPSIRTLLGLPSAEDRRIALAALDSVGILDKVWARAGALSGGQKQRVAIARALTQEPGVMLADEPVASLDPPTAHAVMHDLRRINAERGLTVLINIHLMDLARQYTTRMIGLRDGRLVYDGPAAAASDADFEQIYGRPIQPRDRLGTSA
ncbi:phosphonate ABC transporter ATP-binding protein [Leucobacter chromiireducens]|uniref:Phosphonate ABC transporter ATP-binding protein n=1 Tax=Leucobacter chromiireducens subsp. solipictus TaxID=398235 RepID=A0ABS1SF33_9MICO|nr:phosphonate ABC transporter ATP-binding protein [Leucobacter chromiireducens]MBL3679163.1 phosphonate ABC transporter ATP-binding protein [Leucobacter chromiireducens subsp. solipictus]